MRTLSVSIAAAALVLTTVAAAQADLPPGGTFTDDNGNVHEGYIEAIAAAGITKGCNPPINDEYCPADYVTRGQMAAFLVRTLGLSDDGGHDWFTDDNGNIFESDINRLAQAGITKGCNPPANDRFCPQDRVTRGEMAAFLVRAYGYTDPGPGDWFTDDDGNIFEGAINRLAQAGVTKGCNPPVNDHYCPYSNVRRDEMATFLGRAAGLDQIVPPPPVTPAIETVVSGLDFPVFATSPPGDDRLFVVEKPGYIRIVRNDTLEPGVFLDVHTLVSSGSEQGLLGLAFDPDYASNGLFYVYYTDTGGDSHVVEYSVSADPDVADAGSARNILTVSQPFSNHNGGMIMFDPDGYLLIGLGDGGSGGDPYETGQNNTDLLGSLLRIGVAGDDFPGDSTRNYTIPPDNPYVGKSGADEVWAYGLRNPWRYSIDTETGLLYIADVGQSAWEEVDVAASDAAGLDYGWDNYEGNHCYNDPSGATNCSTTGLTFPVYEYSHSEGCSITGGYVYRGSELPDLQGHYFFADYCAGELRSFRYVNGTVDSDQNWSAELGNLGRVTSFGVDSSNRLYIMNSAGDLMRLTAAP
jgi:glucose/arabinose dehydrogenase